MALWMIWNCLNKVIFENKEPSHAGIWNKAAIYTLEFMEINKRDMVTSGNLDTRWSPPHLESSFKLNIAIS